MLLVASGCAGPRVQIFSVAPPAPVVALDDPIYFGGKLLSTTPRPDHVVHIFKQGHNAPEFRLIERDAAGALVRDLAVPAYYAGGPSHRFVALRPDGKVLAYLRTDENLYAHDLDARSESVLLSGVGHDAFLGGMAWTDMGHLVIVIDRSSGPDRILVIDTASRRVVAERETEDPFDLAVSASGQRLAVTQMVRGSGIEVFDTGTLERVAEIPNSNASSWTNLPAWNPTGSKLAYVGADHWISVWAPGVGAPARLVKIPDADVCYFLAFPSDETLLYECGPPTSSSPPDEEQISYLDIGSGRVTATIAAERLSPCVPVGDGSAIACVVWGSVEVRPPRE